MSVSHERNTLAWQCPSSGSRYRGGMVSLLSPVTTSGRLNNIKIVSPRVETLLSTGVGSYFPNAVFSTGELIMFVWDIVGNERDIVALCLIVSLFLWLCGLLYPYHHFCTNKCDHGQFVWKCLGCLIAYLIPMKCAVWIIYCSAFIVPLKSLRAYCSFYFPSVFIYSVASRLIHFNSPLFFLCSTCT